MRDIGDDKWDIGIHLNHASRFTDIKAKYHQLKRSLSLITHLKIVSKIINVQESFSKDHGPTRLRVAMTTTTTTSTTTTTTTTTTSTSTDSDNTHEG